MRITTNRWHPFGLASLVMLTLAALALTPDARGQDGSGVTAAATQPDAAAPSGPDRADASRPPVHDAARESGQAGQSSSDQHQPVIHPALILPFALLLAAIALMPFIAKHWWEHNYPYVSVALAGLVGVYYIAFLRAPMPWVHGMMEYASFIALLWSLYVVSGGIVINVNRKATPVANAALMLTGAVLANLFGTTGASMLLIRPFIRMNKGHIKPYHVIFFIFIVSNCGGALTPIGDPPLFLGYLHGVPFWWTLQHLWPAWALANGLLLIVFLIVDVMEHNRTPRHHAGDPGATVSILGIHNFLFIIVILIGVFCRSAFEVGEELIEHGVTHAGLATFIFSRELLMVGAGLLALKTTAKSVYQRNEFTFGPIKEVAILFIGIFSTMAPALGWLESNAHRMPIKTPGQFYFSSGALSSVLDNAPTYLTFLKARLGMLDQHQIDQTMEDLHRMSKSKNLTVDKTKVTEGVGNAEEAMLNYHRDHVEADSFTREEVEIAFLLGNPSLSIYIVAISCGAVFFGACTYIGNGPNFMVKSIAESSGVAMPGFIAYVLRFALPILIPIYIVVWAVFMQ